MSLRLTLRPVEYFVAAGEEASITGAAEKVNIFPPVHFHGRFVAGAGIRRSAVRAPSRPGTVADLRRPGPAGAVQATPGPGRDTVVHGVRPQRPGEGTACHRMPGDVGADDSARIGARLRRSQSDGR